MSNQPVYAAPVITYPRYDPIGNREQMTDAFGTHAYAYDALSQVRSVDYPSTLPIQDTSYSHDAVGNRTQVVVGGTPIPYAPANTINQYTTAGGVNFQYDVLDNLIRDGIAGYGYDSQSRMVSARRGEFTTAYSYDPFGRRLTRTLNGNTTRFLYDGDQILAETDQAGNIRAKYLYGPGIDEPLRQMRGGTTTYYHADGLGSPIGLTDTAGNVVERYAYDIYGAPRIMDPAGNPRPVSAYGNTFLFTGREWDPEIGFYHYRARAYHPGIGRFFQLDPLGHLPDVNRFRYVGNNSVNWKDPWGLSGLTCPPKTRPIALRVSE